MAHAARMTAVFSEESSTFSPNFIGEMGGAYLSDTYYQTSKQYRPPWIEQLEPKFEEITNLPKNWDGYNGIAVSHECVSFVIVMLPIFNSGRLNKVPAPHIVPGSDGALQIEWHSKNYDIELNVSAPYHVVATRINQKTGKRQEHQLTSNFEIVIDWLQELYCKADASSIVQTPIEPADSAYEATRRSAKKMRQRYRDTLDLLGE